MTAKEFLAKYPRLRYKIRLEKMHIEGLYYDTYGLDLPAPIAPEDRVQKSPADPGDVLIDKIQRLDKDLERAKEKIDSLIEQCDFIKDVCAKNLSTNELLVITEKYFVSPALTDLKIANKYRYSPAWSQKWTVSAYKTLDQVLAVMEYNHEIPEDLYK